MEATAHLGISPGTRVLGLAVLLKGELIEWKVKTFKESWSKEKQKLILDSILQLCDYYSVQQITIKQIDPLKCSPQLQAIIKSIERLAKERSMQVSVCSLSDLDYDSRTGKKITREDVSERVVEKHPVLRKTFLRERKNRAEYYTKMFEAIAMAELCE